MKDVKNHSEVQRNTYLYQKERNKKLQDRKVSRKMESIINKIGATENAPDITPIINLAQAMVNNDDSDSYHSDDSDGYGSE